MRAELFELVDITADDERLLWVPGQDLVHRTEFGGGLGGDAVAVARLGGGVQHAFLGVHIHADLDAFGGGDIAGHLELFPRGVVALGADEGEDVALAAVLAHEGSGKP